MRIRAALAAAAFLILLLSLGTLGDAGIVHNSLHDAVAATQTKESFGKVNVTVLAPSTSTEMQIALCRVDDAGKACELSSELVTRSDREGRVTFPRVAEGTYVLLNAPVDDAKPLSFKDGDRLVVRTSRDTNCQGQSVTTKQDSQMKIDNSPAPAAAYTMMSEAQLRVSMRGICFAAAIVRHNSTGFYAEMRDDAFRTVTVRGDQSADVELSR